MSETNLISSPSSQAEYASTLLRRCGDRESKFLKEAIKAEREGDHQGAWYYMALRAENNRLIAKIYSSIKRKNTKANPPERQGLEEL